MRKIVVAAAAGAAVLALAACSSDSNDTSSAKQARTTGSRPRGTGKAPTRTAHPRWRRPPSSSAGPHRRPPFPPGAVRPLSRAAPWPQRRFTVDLDDLAPYPTTDAEATADAMAHWLTLSAFVRHHADVHPARLAWEAAGDADRDRLRDAYMLAQQTFVAEYALAFLLREVPMSQADRLAREVWKAFDGDAESAVGDLADWLGEEGVDPHQVLRLIGAAGDE
jgi:hypothetical protein